MSSAFVYKRDPCNLPLNWNLLVAWLQYFLTSYWFSGSLLLEEIVTAYEDYGIDSILEASQMRFHESRELKEAGSADWWRVSFLVLVLFFWFCFIAYHIHCCCFKSKYCLALTHIKTLNIMISITPNILFDFADIMFIMVSGLISNATFSLWQLHEASLFALGSLSEQLSEAQVGIYLFCFF